MAAYRAAMLPERRPVMFSGTPIKIGAGVHVQEGEDGRPLIAVHHPEFGWAGA
jgi:hypothetical protein